MQRRFKNDRELIASYWRAKGYEVKWRPPWWRMPLAIITAATALATAYHIWWMQ